MNAFKIGLDHFQRTAQIGAILFVVPIIDILDAQDRGHPLVLNLVERGHDLGFPGRKVSQNILDRPQTDHPRDHHVFRSKPGQRVEQLKAGR